MIRVLISAPAEIDSANLLVRLSLDAGIAVADRYAADLSKLYGRLVAHPRIGSLRSKLGRGVRIAVVSPYVVLYRFEPTTDHVVVLRILHGKRRITRRLLSAN